MEQLPCGAELLVVSYFNSDNVVPEFNRYNKVVEVALLDPGLEEISCHFLLHQIPLA